MTSTDRASEPSSALVDRIPVCWVAPAPRRPAAPLALWLPPLTRTKEDVLPLLRQLASEGLVAVSLDPWQHGQRGAESGEELARRVFGNVRRHMWPILGQTTLDSLRVIDWAMAILDVGPPGCRDRGGTRLDPPSDAGRV